MQFELIKLKSLIKPNLTMDKKVKLKTIAPALEHSNSLQALLQDNVKAKEPPKPEQQKKKFQIKHSMAIKRRLAPREVLAQGVRNFLVKSIKSQLKQGQLNSKYLTKFEVIDILTPKTYVIAAKNHHLLSQHPQHQKFLYKILDAKSVEAYLGTSSPTEFQIDKVMDEWIHLSPKTTHIVTCYEVFKDEFLYLQFTEFCEGYENVYRRVRDAEFKKLEDHIPKRFIKLVLTFLIQISHAFLVAHSSKLTHGAFDLTQVLLDHNMSHFKVTNFRPWLAMGNDFKFTQHCKTDGVKDSLHDNKMNIAFHRDLYDFGEAVYELMLGKTSKEEVIEQQVLVKSESGEKDKGKDQTSRAPTPDQVNREKVLKSSCMPMLDNIPLSWIQTNQGASLFEILHMCMLIDLSRDTVQIFRNIKRIAVDVYKSCFEPGYKAIYDPLDCPDELLARDIVVSLNNRAAVSQFKIQKHRLGKRVSEAQNQKMMDFQQGLLEHATKIKPDCQESQFNLLCLLWRRGKLFDDQFQEEAKRRFTSSQTFAFVLLAFRKANRFPLVERFEDSIIKMEPASHLENILKNFILDSMQYENSDDSIEGDIQKLHSFQTHISRLVPKSLFPGRDSQTAGMNNDPSKVPSQNVRKIFFSQNEKYVVLITDNQAIVLALKQTKFTSIGAINLPKPTSKKYFERRASSLMKENKSLSSSMDPDEISMGDMSADPAGNDDPVSGEEEDGGAAEKNLMLRKATCMPMQMAASLTPEVDVSDNVEYNTTTLGGGFNFSPWLAAIDNHGEVVTLHDTCDIELVDRVDHHGGSMAINEDGNVEDITAEALPKARFPNKKKIVSKMWVYSGKDFTNFETLPIGDLCPDEIMDMEIDGSMGQGFHDGVNTESNSSWEGRTTYAKTPGPSGVQTAFNSVQMSIDALATRDQQTLHYEHSTPQMRPILAKKLTSIKYAGSNMQSQSSITQTDSAGNIDHNCEEMDQMANPNKHIITLRSKNLFQYDVVLSMNQLSDDRLMLVSKPTLMPGGATLPHSIFKDPQLHKVRDHTKFEYKPSEATGSKDVSPMISIAQSVKSAQDSTFDKRFKTLLDKRDQGPELLGYKSLHYEHLREYIQKHELKGNIIKMPSTDNKHLVCFIKSGQEKGEGNKPHFFVYDIISRQIVRRFYPLIPEFKKEWSSLKHGDGMTTVLDSGTNRSRGMTTRGVTNKWKEQSGTDLSSDDNNSGSNIGNDDTAEEEYDDVSTFAVSPNGNYLVSFVSHEFLTVRTLPNHLNRNTVFKGCFKPTCLVDEHADLDEFFNDYESSLDDEMGSARLDGSTVFKAEPEMTFNNQLTEVASPGGKLTSPDSQVKEEKDVCEISDLDQSIENDDGYDSQASITDVARTKTLADQLVYAYNDFEDYVGSTYEKHLRLFQYYLVLTYCLKNTKSLIYPSPEQPRINFKKLFNYITNEVCEDLATGRDGNDFNYNNFLQMNNSSTTSSASPITQILPRTLGKVLMAIKDYNFTYSVISQPNQLTSAVMLSPNQYSKKVGCGELHPLYTFDQVKFSRDSDRISEIIMSTHPRSFKVAVYYRRSLQIYDQITGQQIFQLVAPSAQKVAFIDSENLVVVQDGATQVYICNLEAHRKAFADRESLIKMDAFQVREYEENMKVSDYAIGMSIRRNQDQSRKSISDNSDDSEPEEETIGIKIINYEEPIKQMITSRNISPYGYIGIIGEMSMTLYLAYAEEESVSYDMTWVINFSELRRLICGRRVELIDFSPSCEEFVSYMSTGEICLWSIRKKTFIKKVCQLDRFNQCPVTELRYLANGNFIAYSKTNNLLMIIDAHAINRETKNGNASNGINRLQKQSTIKRGAIQTKGDNSGLISKSKELFSERAEEQKKQARSSKSGMHERASIIQIRPELEGLGKLLNFRVDNSEKFLVCVFDTNKIGVFDTTNGSIVKIFQENMPDCSKTFIDETCCFLACLDESRRKANIHAFEWLYDVQRPHPTTDKKVKDTTTMDGDSECSENKLKGTVDTMNVATRLRMSRLHMSAISAQTKAQLKVLNKAKKMNVPHEKAEQMIKRQEKRQQEAEKKRKKAQEGTGSKMCAIF